MGSEKIEKINPELKPASDGGGEWPCGTSPEPTAKWLPSSVPVDIELKLLLTLKKDQWFLCDEVAFQVEKFSGGVLYGRSPADFYGACGVIEFPVCRLEEAILNGYLTFVNESVLMSEEEKE